MRKPRREQKDEQANNSMPEETKYYNERTVKHQKRLGIVVGCFTCYTISASTTASSSLVCSSRLGRINISDRRTRSFIHHRSRRITCIMIVSYYSPRTADEKSCEVVVVAAQEEPHNGNKHRGRHDDHEDGATEATRR